LSGLLHRETVPIWRKGGSSPNIRALQEVNGGDGVSRRGRTLAKALRPI
jgi:hypothetical protein